MDDRSLERWFALELGGLGRSLVSARRPLADLLAQPRPFAKAADGSEHAFDPEALRRFDAVLSPLDRRRLRLPLTFVVDKDMPNDAALDDEVGQRLLFALGEVPPGRSIREGRLWISHAQARLLAQRYAGAFQFLTQ